MPYIKKGMGTIRKRRDGRWETRFCFNGKQVTTAANRDAQYCLKIHYEKVKEIKKGVRLERTSSGGKYTLFAWLDEWNEIYIANGKKKNGDPLSKSWKSTVRLVINSHIKKNFVNRPLEKLTVFELEQCSKKTESSRMREDVDTVLCMALAAAKKKGIMSVNVVEGYDKHKHDRETGVPFSPEHQKEILDYAKDNSPFYKSYLTYFWTGSRPSELGRIRPGHFSFGTGSVFIDGTKTKNSRRSIPIFPALNELRDWIQNCKTEFLFTATTKKMLAELYRILDVLKIPKDDYDLYSLRHSFATMIYEAGVDKITRSAWMGHEEKSEVTDKVYTKLRSTHESNQARKVDPNFDPKTFQNIVA